MFPSRVFPLVALLLGACMLSGCDKLTGAADQKSADAEAIGYACRISQKQPEVCMKENETFSPSLILDGWKSADKDILDKVIDVGSISGISAESGKPAEGAPPVEEKKVEKPASDDAKKDAKPVGGKKPANTPEAAQ